MMRVIIAGVVSSLACAVTNGDALSVTSKPIERRIKAVLLRTVISLKSESKTFLRNRLLLCPNRYFLDGSAMESMCVSESSWLHYCYLR